MHAKKLAALCRIQNNLYFQSGRTAKKFAVLPDFFTTYQQ